MKIVATLRSQKSKETILPKVRYNERYRLKMARKKKGKKCMIGLEKGLHTENPSSV